MRASRISRREVAQEPIPEGSQTLARRSSLDDPGFAGAQQRTPEGVPEAQVAKPVAPLQGAVDSVGRFPGVSGRPESTLNHPANVVPPLRGARFVRMQFAPAVPASKRPRRMASRSLTPFPFFRIPV